MTSESANVCKSGCLPLYLPEWRKITKDSFILNIIRGYQLPFTTMPNQIIEPSPIPMSSSDENKVTEAIGKLLAQGAIKKSPEEKGQFISNVFSVPKSDGSVRLVINLKPLNEFIVAPHFKMEDYRTAAALLRPTDYMAVVDLKQAYHSVAVCGQHQKFLKFRWKETLYQFTCLPFGLNIAPYIFTKIMRPVLAVLRKQGLLSVNFLDDTLLIGNTEHACSENAGATVKLLKQLGFTINEEKSQLIPSTRVKFLGYIFNTLSYTISLPDDKVEKINSKLLLIRDSATPSIQCVAELIGMLTAACPAVTYGSVYVKQLEYDKNRALKLNQDDYSKLLVLSEQSRSDILWWLRSVSGTHRCLRRDKYDIVVTTDASSTGWGGEAFGKQTSGTWSASEAKLHINELELLAVYFCLQSLVVGSALNILVRCDNTTAISYINNQGGCRASGCNKLARQIWKWAEENNHHIYVSYINTKVNVIADSLSREEQDSSDFMLKRKYFDKICKALGYPKVDLFATRLTKQCPLFVSWNPDPESMSVDAFTITWSSLSYAFPPFCLIPRVLKKLIEDKADVIVVAPDWSAQAWYPLYMSLVKSRVITFKSKDLLWCPYLNRNHELSQRVSLMAAVLSASR